MNYSKSFKGVLKNCAMLKTFHNCPIQKYIKRFFILKTPSTPIRPKPQVWNLIHKNKPRYYADRWTKQQSNLAPPPPTFVASCAFHIASCNSTNVPHPSESPLNMIWLLFDIFLSRNSDCLRIRRRRHLASKKSANKRR